MRVPPVALSQPAMGNRTTADKQFCGKARTCLLAHPDTHTHTAADAVTTLPKTGRVEHLCIYQKLVKKAADTTGQGTPLNPRQEQTAPFLAVRKSIHWRTIAWKLR